MSLPGRDSARTPIGTGGAAVDAALFELGEILASIARDTDLSAQQTCRPDHELQDAGSRKNKGRTKTKPAADNDGPPDGNK